MKIFHKISMATLIGVVALGLVGLINSARAASSPSLGAAATFGILASTYTNIAAGTINGDLGFTTPPAPMPTVNGTIHVADGIYSTAGTNQGSALNTLNALTCNFTFNSATDLSLLPQPLVPGVYCIVGAMSIGTGGITLSGAGTYIFRSSGALNTVANSQVRLISVSACDVFWTPGAAATLGANSTFIGTIIDDSGITVGSTVTWTGRALAFGETVTTNASSVSVPTCLAVPVVPITGNSVGTITVVKNVINDNGGTKVVSDFPLFINGAPVISGTANIEFGENTYHVTETADPGYIGTFSGQCDSNGNITLPSGDNLVCFVTNNDIAPVIVPVVPPPVVVVPPPIVPTVIVPEVITPIAVVAPLPAMPNTGLPPQESNSALWYTLVISGVILMSGSLFFILRKQKI